MNHSCNTTPCSSVRFNLLRAKEQQIETAVAYIETLRDYWLSRGDAGLAFEWPPSRFDERTDERFGRTNRNERK